MSIEQVIKDKACGTSNDILTLACHRLQSARKALLYSRSELSRKLTKEGCDISTRKIKALEEGGASTVTIAQVFQLLTTLQVPPNIIQNDLEGDRLINYTAGCLATIIQEAGTEGFYTVIDKAMHSTP